MRKGIMLSALLILTLTAIPLSAQDVIPDIAFGGVGVAKEVNMSDAFPFFGVGYRLDDKTLNLTALDIGVLKAGQQIENGSTIFGQPIVFTARTGLARQLFVIKRVSVYALADVGIVNAIGTTTSSVGWGGFVATKINGWFGAFVLLQGERSPLLGTDLKPRFGVSFDLSALRGQ